MSLSITVPHYITICSSGNICYSDCDSLYCIKPDGEEVFSYDSPHLRDAWGVTTDNHGNVYIVGHKSYNVKYRDDFAIFVYNIQLSVVSIKTTCSWKLNIIFLLQYNVYKCTIRSKSVYVILTYLWVVKV
jgi:hypothetical protein